MMTILLEMRRGLDSDGDGYGNPGVLEPATLKNRACENPFGFKNVTATM